MVEFHFKLEQFGLLLNYDLDYFNRSYYILLGFGYNLGFDYNLSSNYNLGCFDYYNHSHSHLSFILYLSNSYID